MYVIKNKKTGNYWKSHTSEVDLQQAKIYKNKSSAEQILKFYDDMNLEILEIIQTLKLK